MLGVTYIGHATLLIEIGGKRLLTDPNFDPSLGKILPRVSAPGIALDALPKLDAILVTHAHADHLSFDSLNALPEEVPLFAPVTLRSSMRAGKAIPSSMMRLLNLEVPASRSRNVIGNS